MSTFKKTNTSDRWKLLQQVKLFPIEYESFFVTSKMFLNVFSQSHLLDHTVLCLWRWTTLLLTLGPGSSHRPDMFPLVSAWEQILYLKRETQWLEYSYYNNIYVYIKKDRHYLGGRSVQRKGPYTIYTWVRGGFTRCSITTSFFHETWPTANTHTHTHYWDYSCFLNVWNSL